MFKDMRRKAARNVIGICLIFMLFGVIILFVLSKDIKNYFNETDITNASISEIKKNNYVKIKLDKNNLYGCFSEEYNDKNVTEKYYYLVLVGRGDDKRFMAVKLDDSNYNTLKKIEQEYTDLDNGIESDDHTVLTIAGEVKKMDWEAYNYFKSFISKYGYSDEEMMFVSLNLIVEEDNVNDYILLFMSICMGLIVIPIIIFLFVLFGGSLIGLKKRLNANGLGYLETIESDYNNSLKIGNNINIGKKYTFIVHGIHNIIIENKDIVWVYSIKTTHRTNGIKTGISYTARFFDINKKSYKVAIPNDEKSTELLNAYFKLTDTIVLGFDKKYLNMIKKDFECFLNIAYRNHTYGGKEQDTYL